MKEKKMIMQKQQEFIEGFNGLEDWFMQYEFLLQIAGETPHIPEEKKTKENQIQGCQSVSWLELKKNGTKLQIAADSEAQIIRGILGIYVMLLNEAELCDVAELELDFTEKTAIRDQISGDWLQAMSKVGEKIKNFCKRESAESEG